jgi:ribose transport system permease protein
MDEVANASREAPTDAAEAPLTTPPEQRRRFGMGALALRLAHYHTAAVAIVLLILVVVFSLQNSEAFLTFTNFKVVSLQAMATMLLGVGLTFLIISGGIDLSVGAVVVFSSVISAKVMTGAANTWTSVFLGLAAALGAGLLWGLMNALLVAKGRLNPLIVTLGTLGAANGLAEIITKGTDIGTFPKKLTSFGVATLAGVPYVLWITLIVTLIGGVVLSKTRFGAHTYAIGANEEAARRAGIRVERHQTILYVGTGGLAGLTAFLLNAYFATTTIAGHTTDNLQAITGVLLGGASLFGGVGNMIGTAIGIYIPAVLADGFTIVGLSSFWQEVAVGIVLIGAVALDRVRRQNQELR